MGEHLPEKDWKRIRSIKDEALRTACDRIFEKLSEVIDSRGADSHTAYLKLWKILKREDEKIALMFNDLKRSTAIFKLAMWKKNGILSDQYFQDFSVETQNRVTSLCNIGR